MKKLLPVGLALALGFGVGWLTRPKAVIGERPAELMLTLPDATDPSGARTSEYTVYRVTSGSGISGALAPPEGTRPTIVTLIGRERVTYYGTPKR